MNKLIFLLFSSVILFSCRTKELAEPIERQFPGTDQLIRLSKETNFSAQSEDLFFDDFEIVNIKQDGQWLVFETIYSGGCESHFFLANWDGRMMKSLPPQANLVIAHQHKPDSCRERIEKKWAIDVRPLFERGESEVLLNLMTNEKKIAQIKLVAVE